MPLKYVEKWLTPELERAIANLDKIPFRVDQWEQFKAAREAIVRCQKVIKELRHLAFWVDTGKKKENGGR